MTCVSHTVQQEVMMIDTAQAFGVDIGGIRSQGRCGST